jgi:hypothetical protein
MASPESRSPAAYSGPDRLLHRIALGSRPVMETSFDIERAMFARALPPGSGARPVFVCGLARAGTSLVTRLLDGSGVFASLRYRDMPFPLAPNLWARLSGGDTRQVAAFERAHGDGLDHDLDTPEAIEEVFWRCFEGDRYIADHGLLPNAPRPETMEGYRSLMGLVCLRSGRNRYLAKNNNHVLRLQSLIDEFPDAVLVHPFRHPVKQAASLLAQHRRTCARQSQDPFSRSFAHWLGHHEFGMGQRPHLLPGAPLANEDPLSIEYWLDCWESVYRFLLDQGPAVSSRQLFVDYDELCRRPSEVLRALATTVGCPSLDPAAVTVSKPLAGKSTGSAVHAALRARVLMGGPVEAANLERRHSGS